jgi:hypothetical protein
MFGRHREVVPIATRQSGPGSIGRLAPLEDLLPPGGASAPAPALAPHRALALDALLVNRRLRDRPRDAGPWGEPAFAREVDRIRRDLAPIVSRRGLAASFGREACNARSLDRPDHDGVPDRLRVAYAVRWLELGDGRPRPPWTSLVTGRD